VFEGLAFVTFRPDVMPEGAILSVLGNTVTHGLLLGAVPLLVLYPALNERLGTLLT
jgi:hypothetical protein